MREAGSQVGQAATRRGVAACLAACLMSAGALFVGVTPAAAGEAHRSHAANAAGWQASLSFDGPLVAVSCASASHCVAVGGSGFAGSVPVLVTSDGGSTWSAASVPRSVGSLQSVSCPTSGLCVAVGVAAATTSFESVLQGGAPFASLPQPIIVSSTDGGVTWSQDNLPPALAGSGSGSGSSGSLLTDVSCASASFCMVVGALDVRTAGGEGPLVLLSTDGGAGWSLQPQTSAVGSFSSLSCPAAGTCFASGTAQGANQFGNGPYVIVATASGGSAWSVQAESGSPETVACSSVSDCTAVGATVSATSDGGASWTRVGNGLGGSSGYFPSGQGVSSLSCPTTTFCVAGLPSGLAVTTDGGSSWSFPALAPQVSFVTSVSCASTYTCTAVGSAGAGAALLGSSDGGSTWSVEDGAASTYGLTGTSCASASTCMVVGGSTIEGTPDGGASWNAVALPSGQAAGDVYLHAVSCGSGSSCVAVGGTEPSALVPGAAAVVDVGSPTGSAMQSVAPPAGVVALWAVSCAGTGTCVALGQSLDGAPVIVVSADGGRSWSSAAVPAGVAKVVSVSCASAADCVLVADAVRAPSQYYYLGRPGMVLASTDGGATWVSRGLLALPGRTSGKGGGSLDPTSVSCGTPEDCVATGFNGPGVLYSTDGGATWLAGSVTHGSNGELGLLSGIAGNATVSCSGPADCVMAEVFGVLLRSTDGGATWDVETALPLGSLAPTFNGYSGIGSSPIGLSCATGSACVLAAGVAAYTTTDGGVGAPSAPNDVHAVGAPGAAVVTWAPPLIDGGAPASSYVVVASPGGSSFTVPASATEAVVTGLSDGKSYTFTVQAVNVAGAGPASSASNPAVPSPAGYWSVGADGGIYAFGSASFAGSLPGDHVVPNAPIVGVAPTPDGGGYWLADAKGGVYAFGDAKFLGSLPGDKLAPFGSIVGIVAAPGGSGYWLVSSEGFVYAFGDAVFVGPTVPSKDGITSIVGMASAPDGGGYWLVSADGGVYAFGSARFSGSLPGDHVVPSAPVVGMASRP